MKTFIVAVAVALAIICVQESSAASPAEVSTWPALISLTHQLHSACHWMDQPIARQWKSNDVPAGFVNPAVEKAATEVCSLLLHLTKSPLQGVRERCCRLPPYSCLFFVPHTASTKQRCQSRLFPSWGSIHLHSQRRWMQHLLPGLIVPAPNSSAQLWFPSKMQFLKLVLWIFVGASVCLLFYRLTVIRFSPMCSACFSK